MPTLEGEQREGSASLASSDGRPVYEEHYSFLVKADSKTQPRSEIFATPGLPIIQHTTTANGLAVCTTVDPVRREANSLYYDVAVTFSSEVTESSGAETFVPGAPGSIPPVEWVPVYETQMERMQRVATKDVDGTPIVNSAGQAFETGLQIGRFIPIWDLYQFEPATVTDEDIIERNETVNSVTFKGREPKTLLLTVVNSVIWRFLGNRVRLTRYEVRWNKENWRHKRLDVGTQYLNLTEIKDYKSADGSIMLGSLDGNGGKQTPGQPPAVREFDVFESKNFKDFLRT